MDQEEAEIQVGYQFQRHRSHGQNSTGVEDAEVISLDQNGWVDEGIVGVARDEQAEWIGRVD